MKFDEFYLDPSTFRSPLS